MRVTIGLAVLLAIVATNANAQNDWQQNNPNIYFLGGKVGIGTGSPAYPLSIRTGTEQLVAGLYVRNESTSLSPPNDKPYGLFAQADGPLGRGAIGFSIATTGEAYGFLGQADSTLGRGVGGLANASSGEAYGVQGQTNSTSGKGVFGLATATSGSAQGVAGLSPAPAGVGVYGEASYTGTSGDAIGMRGRSLAVAGIGIKGEALGIGTSYGVLGEAPGSGYAVYADGNFASSGTKTFMIDHPADPENRLLVHYCAEGPEPFLIYRGTATLDASGAAVVTLPEYFDQIARDPQYQLTAVGAPAPSMHVASKVSGGRFTIGGGTAGLEVCWTVTAVRNDLWVRANPPAVEKMKPEHERGTYLHPELYGQPATRRTFYTPPIEPGRAMEPVTVPSVE
jgi:hypothetical protein